VAAFRVSIKVLSYVRQMCWDRYGIRKGLVLSLSVISVVAKPYSFFSLIIIYIGTPRGTEVEMTLYIDHLPHRTFKNHYR
jgi:hypothetical protein